MAMATSMAGIEQIGETAGLVWRLLHDSGPMSLTRLIKESDLQRDLVMQALGWLAREDKISIDGDGRSKTIALI